MNKLLLPGDSATPLPGAPLVTDREIAVCHTCRLKHPCAPNSNEAIEFFRRHQNHKLELAKPNADLSERWRELRPDLFPDYRGNSNIKEAFGTATAFTKTNANIAASVTAGWVSNGIDNSANLYLDALVEIELAAVNTAPAGTQTLYLYAFSLIEGTAYTSTGSGLFNGTEATATYPSVTTLAVVCPVLGTVPYPVQNKAINSPAFSVAACFGGTLPVKWGIGMVNDMGQTLSVTNIYYIEVYNTVI